MPQKVKKRNNQLVDFDRKKIETAIKLAMNRVNYQDTEGYAPKIANEVARKTREVISVYDIEDIVIQKLDEYELTPVRNEYVGYRYHRKQEREKQKRAEYMENYVGDVIDLRNLENENANMREEVFTAKMTRISSEMLREYAMNNMLSDKVKEAFVNNKIYIHDFNTYPIGLHNCLTADLTPIFNKGFNTHNGDVRPPKNIKTAMQQVAVIFQCISNEQFGGVASGKIDRELAPFVDMTFKKHFKNGLKYINEGTCLFRNDEIYINNKDLEEEFPRTYQYAYDLTWEDTTQGAEALIHNLNTLQSRAGNQLPFTSINFGIDTTPEGRMVTKSILEATIKGIGKNHTTPIFPISIFQVAKGINKEEGDPNYDLFKLAVKCSSMRIYPNFVSANPPHLPEPSDVYTYHSTMG